MLARLRGAAMGRSIFALALLFAGFAASAAPEPRPADLNTGLGIEDNGASVRLRGVIDACLPTGCFICPDWEKASRQDDAFRSAGCLSLMNWKDANASLMLDELFRFTEVEIVARFHFNQPSDDDVNVFCLDTRRCQKNGFEDVEIRTVFERRPVEKIPNPYRADAIVPINPADDAALRKLFWEDPDFSLVYLDGPDTEIRTYVQPQKDQGAQLQGWLCYARKSVVTNPDEPFPWPTTYRAIQLRSPANPYRCRLAWKEKGVWRIVRELQKLPVYGLD
jgi:hypothetical protein